MGLFTVSLDLTLCIEAQSGDEAREVFLSHVACSDFETTEVERYEDVPRHFRGQLAWRKDGISDRTCGEIAEWIEQDRERLAQEQDAAEVAS